MIIYGSQLIGVSITGATPIFFYNGKYHEKWMMTGGTPLFLRKLPTGDGWMDHLVPSKTRPVSRPEAQWFVADLD